MIVLENKEKIIDKSADFFTGFDIPFFGERAKTISLTKTTFENKKAQLKMLLLTRLGERFYLPQYGSAIYDILFEQLGDNFEKKLKNNIEREIHTWVNELSIQTIDVNTDRNNRVNINITLQDTDTLEIDDMNLIVSQEGRSWFL